MVIWVNNGENRGINIHMIVVSIEGHSRKIIISRYSRKGKEEKGDREKGGALRSEAIP